MGEPAIDRSPLDRPTRTDPDAVVVLRGASWADYQRLLELRGEHARPRLTFLHGVLEIMSPSRSHESIKSMFGCLVEAFCMEHEIDISPFGSWTLERKEVERGVEPDECYVLGTDPDPAQPDIAIEVIWTHGGIDKLEVYRKLGVQEVWFWRDGKVALYHLEDERYEPIQRSRLIPTLDHEELLTFIEIFPMTKAIRAYRAVLAARSTDESPE